MATHATAFEIGQVKAHMFGHVCMFGMSAALKTYLGQHPSKKIRIFSSLEFPISASQPSLELPKPSTQALHLAMVLHEARDYFFFQCLLCKRRKKIMARKTAEK